MDISILATGVFEAVTGLEGLLARSVDLHPVLNLIAEDFHVVEAAQFSSEGARGGDSWAPLAPSTVRQRGSAHPIEHVTGLLERSLTKEGAAGSFKELTGPMLQVGTDVAYAGYQQTGTSRMPARPLLGVTLADEVRWAELVGKYLSL